MPSLQQTVHIWSGSGGRRTPWKICPGEPRNLANSPVEFGKICAENCDPYVWHTCYL